MWLCGWGVRGWAAVAPVSCWHASPCVGSRPTCLYLCRRGHVVQPLHTVRGVSVLSVLCGGKGLGNKCSQHLTLFKQLAFWPAVAASRRTPVGLCAERVGGRTALRCIRSCVLLVVRLLCVACSLQRLTAVPGVANALGAGCMGRASRATAAERCMPLLNP